MGRCLESTVVRVIKNYHSAEILMQNRNWAESAEIRSRWYVPALSAQFRQAWVSHPFVAYINVVNILRRRIQNRLRSCRLLLEGVRFRIGEDERVRGGLVVSRFVLCGRGLGRLRLGSLELRASG